MPIKPTWRTAPIGQQQKVQRQIMGWTRGVKCPKCSHRTKQAYLGRRNVTSRVLMTPLVAIKRRCLACGHVFESEHGNDSLDVRR